MKLKHAVVEFMLGQQTLAAFVDIVRIYDDKQMTNEQKHKAAFKDIKAIFANLVGFLINLGIKAAVSKLREEQAKNR